jgi:superoxide dismutase, Fe-Mn family
MANSRQKDDGPTVAVSDGMFTLEPLPWPENALAPYISAETISFHHGKHHQGYVTKLNELIAGKPEEKKTLEQIIPSSEGSVFNNAAQIWNHQFYWHCLKPGGGGEPKGDLAGMIKRDFGSFEKFSEAFSAAATSEFGSGWTWLTLRKDKTLAVVNEPDADLPMKHGQKGLLTLDVWEHAYYIDVRNDRAKYIRNFLEHLVDWDFALANLTGA